MPRERSDMLQLVVVERSEHWGIRARQAEEVFAKVNKLDRQMVEGVLRSLT